MVRESSADAGQGPPGFADFTTTHYPALVRLGTLLSGDDRHGEDLAQLSLLAVLRAWMRLHPHGDPEAHARAVVIRLATRPGQRRRRGKRPAASAPERPARTRDSAAIDAQRLLAQLPTHQRVVLVLRYWLGLSEQATAEALDCSLGAVESRTSRALAALRARTGEQLPPATARGADPSTSSSSTASAPPTTSSRGGTDPDPRERNVARNDADVERLLETAARTDPREVDPVAAVLRRRRDARRHTARIAAVTGAVAVCGAVAVAGIDNPGATPTRPPSPAGTVGAPSWTPPSLLVQERGVNGVQVGAPGYVPEVTTANADGTAPCPRAGVITILATTARGASSACRGADSPSAQVAPVDRLDWQFGYPASPGLTLLDGVPVFIADMPYGRASQAVLTAPTRGVQVTISGDEEQVRTLLSSITVQPLPARRLAPARASRTPLALARITDSAGTYSGQSTDRELLRNLVTAVDAAALLRGEPTCLPGPADSVQVDLQSATGSGPDEDPVGEFTYLAADTTGRCPLVFSSTGAVLQLDSGPFLQVLQRLRDSHDEPD